MSTIGGSLTKVVPGSVFPGGGRNRAGFVIACLGCAALSDLAAQTHSTPVARRPHAHDVAVVNSDQNSISVFAAKANVPVDLDPGPGVSRAAGDDPRTLAYTPDGSRLLVVAHRGDGALGSGGAVLVFDATAGYAEIANITTGIGTQPFGIAISHDGAFAAVTNSRSASVSFLDLATFAVTCTFEYAMDPNGSPSAADPDLDGLPDHALPRGIAIAPGDQAIYVTHFLSGHATKLAVTRESGSGAVSAATLAADFDLNRYTLPTDERGDPTFVTEDRSQGFARNLESITIEPSGKRAWVPHVLANVGVRVEATRFSVDNQVYPAVSLLDLESDTFDFGTERIDDHSARIEFNPAVDFGQTRSLGVGTPGSGGFIPTLDLASESLPGALAALRIDRVLGDAVGALAIGVGASEQPLADGKLYVEQVATWFPIVAQGPAGAGLGSCGFSGLLPGDPALIGLRITMQAAFADPAAASGVALSNAALLEIGSFVSPAPYTWRKRVAVPVQVEFTPDGKHAFVVSLASEDIAIFEISDGVPRIRTQFPPRDFNRVPFDAGKPLGEAPNGLALVAAPSGKFNVFVAHAVSHDIAPMIFDSTNANLAPSHPRVSLVLDDTFTATERAGKELFFDATRSLTASNMNGSCVECHFDGLLDGNTWHFGEGPRQTISLAGGPLDYGLLFWKSRAATMATFEAGFRVHQGGNGQLAASDVMALEQWAARHIPLPLHPRKNEALSDAEARGRDLYFGTNDFGQNPALRSANCAECHPDGVFTIDQQLPNDPCKSLKAAFANLQNVNTADEDGILSDDQDLTFSEGGCKEAGGAASTFTRSKQEFGVPTKLGVFATGPYFHHGRALSLRAVIDPASQTSGPSLEFAKNTAHDLRGFVVSFTLQTQATEQDVEDLLAFISRL